MKIKISEATLPQIDFLVAVCERFDEEDGGVRFRPSTDWAQAGPIIEREKIITTFDRGYDSCQPWRCAVSIDQYNLYEGETLLIAAMRCYVASKLGDEIDPQEDWK